MNVANLQHNFNCRFYYYTLPDIVTNIVSPYLWNKTTFFSLQHPRL